MAINQFQQNMKEYESFYNSIDGLFMGRGTFEACESWWFY